MTRIKTVPARPQRRLLGEVHACRGHGDPGGVLRLRAVDQQRHPIGYRFQRAGSISCRMASRTRYPAPSSRRSHGAAISTDVRGPARRPATAFFFPASTLSERPADFLTKLSGSSQSKLR